MSLTVEEVKELPFESVRLIPALTYGFDLEVNLGHFPLIPVTQILGSFSYPEDPVDAAFLEGFPEFVVTLVEPDGQIRDIKLDGSVECVEAEPTDKETGILLGLVDQTLSLYVIWLLNQGDTGDPELLNAINSILEVREVEDKRVLTLNRESALLHAHDAHGKIMAWFLQHDHEKA